jgi:Type VI secretion system VasI, EvfG, VC_A0118
MGLLVVLGLATRSQATRPVNGKPVQSAARTPAAVVGDVAPAAAAPTSAAQPARPVEESTHISTPQWIESGPAHRRRTGVNGFVFELAAVEDVKVWRKRVRPVLTIRCVGKTTEVFVMTYAPASVEETGKHTVQVSFDGEPGVTQTWEHSVDHDALFTLDGSTLARQIVGARTMKLAFIPFNAPPAVATFSVAGFDTQVESSQQKCGWK